MKKGLLALGVGNGSKVEALKAASVNLRGDLAAQATSGATTFADDEATLLKFHGSYQEDDRDRRRELRAAGEKAWEFMVRSRIPGGAVTARQYLVEDALAEEFANGTLRITSRQGFQLHGVLKGDLKPVIARINDALLTTLGACGDVNRNVMTCPLSSDLATAHAIAQRLAPRSRAYHEIWLDGENVATVAEEEPIYGKTYLPRKFKIGIAPAGDNCIDVYSQDLGLVSHGDAFTFIVGGGMGMTHGKAETYPRAGTPLCDVPQGLAVEAVEAVVCIQRDHGDRENRRHARLKYLIDEMGVQWFFTELQNRLGVALQPPRPLVWKRAEDHLGWRRQPDGRHALGLYVETGRIRGQLRLALRAAVERFGPGIRLTPQQNIILTVPPADRAPLQALLESHGVRVDPAGLGTRRLSMACPALPTCGLAITEAERALPHVLDDIHADLERLGLDGEKISVRMTGCPNGCARPYLGDVGFVGVSRDAYHVFVGGDAANTRLNVLFAESVRVDRLAAVLRPLFVLWREGRVDNEPFGEFCHRVGIERLRQSQPLVEEAVHAS